MKTLKLIFDADGVVCTGGLFTPHLERDYGIEPKSLAAFFASTFPHCITGHKNLLVEIAPVLSTIGWRKSPEAFLEFWFTREHVVDDRLLACVAELRRSGVACYLGTNQEKHRAAYMRERMGFAQHFERVFASCELGVAKPDPQFFSAIATTLACHPGKWCSSMTPPKTSRLQKHAAGIPCTIAPSPTSKPS